MAKLKLVGIFDELRNYRGLLGAKGAWLASRNLLFDSSFEISVEVPGLPQPIHLRFISSDVMVLRQVFLSEEYAWNLPAAPKVIVDGGSNVGITAVFFANRYPEAKIIAIEPEARNFELLRRNVAAYPLIIPVCGALWHENGSVDVVDPGEGNWGYRTEEGTVAQGKALRGAVRAFTMDCLMAEYGLERIDLLKIDIEGAEKELFSHANGWLSKVETILMELHDQFKAGCTRTVYRATEGFKCEGRKGEVVMFSRNPGVTAATLPSKASPHASGGIPGQPPIPLPLKIVEAQRRGI